MGQFGGYCSEVRKRKCDGSCGISTFIRVFHEHTELTIMIILASQAFLCENKTNPATKCYSTEH